MNAKRTIHYIVSRAKSDFDQLLVDLLGAHIKGEPITGESKHILAGLRDASWMTDDNRQLLTDLEFGTEAAMMRPLAKCRPRTVQKLKESEMDIVIDTMKTTANLYRKIATRHPGLKDIAESDAKEIELIIEKLRMMETYTI